VIGMAAALIAIKAAVLFAVARAAGLESRRALKLGLLLSQGGEFAFVLFAAAQNALLIEAEAASLFGAIVTLSMATTPFLMMLNDKLDTRYSCRAADLEGPEDSPTSRAIVVGYGRFGQTVAQIMMAKGIAVTLIDSKPSQIEVSGSFGMKVYYGDGTRLDLLRLAGAADAEAIFFCHDDGTRLSARRLEPILEAFPQAAVSVRAYDRLHFMELSGLDIKCVIREVFESAVCMGRQALLQFGIAADEAERVVEEYLERDRQRLERQSESGDIRALRELIFSPDNQIGELRQDSPAPPAP
jgi:voltage-gated potassium channel Kch